MCASHTLNLIGNCAAESCSGALHYFDFVQNLYVYFLSSTRRWNILLSSLPDTQSKHIKRISDTRWAAGADAVPALRSNHSLFTYSQGISEKNMNLGFVKISKQKINSLTRSP